jgi:hypothetical protein
MWSAIEKELDAIVVSPYSEIGIRYPWLVARFAVVR